MSCPLLRDLRSISECRAHFKGRRGRLKRETGTKKNGAEELEVPTIPCPLSLGPS